MIRRLFAPIAKAAAGSITGFAAALGGACLDGQLDGGEVIAAAGLGLIAGFGVYVAPKNNTNPRRKRP